MRRPCSAIELVANAEMGEDRCERGGPGAPGSSTGEHRGQREDTVTGGSVAYVRVVRWQDATALETSLDAPVVVVDDVRGRQPAAQFDRHIFSYEELRRSARFRLELNRCEYLGARGIVRAFVAPRVGLSPAELQLGTGPAGKPRLLDDACRGISFSVSHSHGRVACAFLRGGEVGVDIEVPDRPVYDLASLARRVFSRAELDALQRAAPDRVESVFLRTWTRKEAVLKAAGVGLIGPTTIFDVVRRSEGGLEDVSPVHFAARVWTCRSMAPEPGLELAVAHCSS